MNEDNPYKHIWDKDGCCIKCGFDGTEWWHLERMKPKDERDQQPFCEFATTPQHLKIAEAEQQEDDDDFVVDPERAPGESDKGWYEDFMGWLEKHGNDKR